MLGRRTPSRWHIARIIEISHSSKSIISCISIPTISDTAGFGTFRIMLLPCPSADATAIERRSVPGESVRIAERQDRDTEFVEFFHLAVFDTGLVQSLRRRGQFVERSHRKG